ncbi:unnamed protein product [Dicrocoelium dendriticum]|nr:unnamed protein product [Dicrocoelium dendriticum]
MGKRVHVQFTKLKLDSKFAWLRVLDGDDCAAPQLKLVESTDVYIPFNCTSTNAAMTVVFASAIGSKVLELSAEYSEGKHFKKALCLNQIHLVFTWKFHATFVQPCDNFD